MYSGCCSTVLHKGANLVYPLSEFLDTSCLAIHRELAGTDVIMSPARRSIRLADRGVKCSAEKLVLPSLLKVPDDVNFAYCPNNALL